MSDVTLDSTIIEIETVRQYFETFNAGAFEATARLFAVDGVMHAPFRVDVAGRDAIATYLSTEAKGMQAVPQDMTTLTRADGSLESHVTGFAKFAGLKVKIAWIFHLNEAQAIVEVRIKLIASAQELLKMRDAQPQ